MYICNEKEWFQRMLVCDIPLPPLKKNNFPSIQSVLENIKVYVCLYKCSCLNWL